MTALTLQHESIKSHTQKCKNTKTHVIHTSQVMQFGTHWHVSLHFRALLRPDTTGKNFFFALVVFELLCLRTCRPSDSVQIPSEKIIILIT